jgi:hypothetical protein
MVTGIGVPTAVVFTLNVAVVAPPATVTLAGTVAAGLLLDSATMTPPDSAGTFSVTVPVEDLPPSTVAGFKDTVESAGVGTVTINVADVCVPS